MAALGIGAIEAGGATAGLGIVKDTEAGWGRAEGRSAELR